MIKLKVKDQTGKTVGEEILNKKIFEVPVKPDLIHQVVAAQAANIRPVIAHTKDRSEVSGGGRKPWRQKGTGRARHGSIRSPIWKGGGVTFGPRSDRNFTQKINKKMRRKALFMVLSDRAKNKKIIILDKLELPQSKTKILSQIFTKLGIKNNTLLVLPEKNDLIQRTIHNLTQAQFLPANSLNVLSVIRNQYIVITQAALQRIYKIFIK